MGRLPSSPNGQEREEDDERDKDAHEDDDEDVDDDVDEDAVAKGGEESERGGRWGVRAMRKEVRKL